ncbi:AAA family ATPase [Ramlibacter rhizophilus]|uniref:AAA family ATPase n=1 Tax=Ramlibacter rhizophilus TaxID=1781167 RepID=A0A4Z0BJW4_9BURK|nr:AAA family ATPase [Ramlibacter rhizophilus]TFY98547.1 AAA family ATPase [Ramlibacter rhizophilus]
MYAPYFGLRQEPFSIAPDPRYLYMSERHREALAHLLYGLSCGGGFVLLTGEIGTGKTTVCRCFLEQVPPHCNLAYIFNPKLTVVELLQSICDEFRVPVTPRPGVPPTVKDYVDPLNAFLLQAHAQGRNNVLIIDEAQNLSADVLEQLRLLTNLETASRKLLQVVLIGQPELRDMLARPELEQLAQRVVARYHLQPLDEEETALYVQHRLQVAGLERAVPFDRRAIRRIHRHARGVPRRINLLCDRAMLGAYAHTRGSIGADTVDQAAREVFGAREVRRAGPALALWALGGLAALGAAYWAGTGAWRELPLERWRTALLPAAVASPTAEPAAAPVNAKVVEREAAAVTAKAPERETATRPIAAVAKADPPAAAPALLRSEEAAWRELALRWNAPPPADRPACAALADQGLRCFSGTAPLPLIRRLDRPGVITLDAGSDQPSYALLVSLGRDTATLRAGGSEQTVTLKALSARWNGDFATVWRTPVAYTGTEDDLRRDSETLAWAATQLARGKVQERDEIIRSPATLRSRLRRFQADQGLPVSGMLTPWTYMQLNRVARVDEPRLQPQP